MSGTESCGSSYGTGRQEVLQSLLLQKTNLQNCNVVHIGVDEWRGHLWRLY